MSTADAIDAIIDRAFDQLDELTFPHWYDVDELHDTLIDAMTTAREESIDDATTMLRREAENSVIVAKRGLLLIVADELDALS